MTIGRTTDRGRALLGVAALLLLAGCGGVVQEWSKPGAAGMTRLAVLPFGNQTPVPRAGSVASELVLAELLATGAVAVVDPSVVADLLRRESLEPADAERLPSAQRLGHLLQVSHVLQGSVTEYRYRPGVSETPVAGLTARVVEVATGEVVWTASHVRAGSSWFRDHGLAGVVQSIARDMAVHLTGVLGGTRAR